MTTMGTEKADRRATLALGLGAASFLLTVFAGIPAIWLAVKVRPHASETGRKRAVGAIVLGVIGTVFTLIVSQQAREERDAKIAEARAACQPPKVFTKRPGTTGLEVEEWACASQEEIDGWAAAAAAAAEQAERETKNQKANEPEKDGESGASSDQPDSAAWLREVESNCKAYNDAPNEIKRSDLFNQNQSLIKGQKLRGVHGRLKRIDTNQGGSEVHLWADIGGFSFTSMSPTLKGGALKSIVGIEGVSGSVKNSLREMREGQCVKIFGKVKDTMTGTEKGRVCRATFSMKVDRVEAAPEEACK
jgi:hypothetical protein